MIKIIRSLCVPLLLLLSSNSLAVTYKVTFTGTWNSSHSNPYPFSAHFSDMIGATHTTGSEFWRNGGTASPGVRSVAETGGTSTMRAELIASKQNGSTGDIIQFGSLFGLPNSDTQTIEVASDKPFITLISMIAPSPDWFVGVSGLSLQQNGQWIQDMNIELRPYDAGTEEGSTFSLSNPATTPQGTIVRNFASPFFGRPVIGNLRFELLTVLPTPDPVPGDNAAMVTSILSLLLD